MIGVNGIGKSTLLRSLAKVQPSISGAVFLQNTALTEVSQKQLAKEISVVLTETIPSKNLTALELISLGRQPYTNWIDSITKKDKKAIDDAIALVNIASIQHKKCYELSDGQLQKVMIARALAQDTPVMLLDEPTAHLDLYHKVQILKMLQEIAHTTNKTILFTTHEIPLALQLADLMLVLDNNTNPFGTPKELIAQKHIENLFPKDMISFDAASNAFRIK